jgi:polynucleotide 5'-kinase involved in rRNA processing
MPMLIPKTVFTPGKLPIEPGNVYSNRLDAERFFNKALDRSLVPLVYGEYGVGKTSLARYLLLDYAKNSKLVNV